MSQKNARLMSHINNFAFCHQEIPGGPKKRTQNLIADILQTVNNKVIIFNMFKI